MQTGTTNYSAEENKNNASHSYIPKNNTKNIESPVIKQIYLINRILWLLGSDIGG